MTGDSPCKLALFWNKSVRAHLSRCHRQGLVEVPLGRYFLWVGSVLLAMMFIAGWVWPSAAPVPAPAHEAVAAQGPTDPTNSMILRIQSARKWPDKIVFDTSIPTIVPPPAPVVAAIVPATAPSAAAVSPLEARAEMKPAAPPASVPPKRVARVHRRNARPAVSTVASAYPQNYPSSWASASPTAPAWSFRW
jgi:hypothetical protein